MEEPTGSEASAQNGAGSPRGWHAPNSNNNSSSWLNMKGPLSPFNSRAAAGPAHHKLSYVGRVVREIVETERMYVQDLRSIVEVSADARLPWLTSHVDLFVPEEGKVSLAHLSQDILPMEWWGGLRAVPYDSLGFLTTLSHIGSLGSRTSACVQGRGTHH